MSKYSSTFSERLWAKIRTGAVDECWPWTAGTNGDGYGLIRPGPADMPRVLAHRAVFEEAHGPLQSGEVARHNCDNPPCCNPAHLIRGTRGDNANDTVERGQHARAGGWRRKQSLPVVTTVPAVKPSGPAVLTLDDVAQIRALRAGGMLLREIAEQFGVSRSTIHCIATGKTWRTEK